MTEREIRRRINDNVEFIIYAIKNDMNNVLSFFIDCLKFKMKEYDIINKSITNIYILPNILRFTFSDGVYNDICVNMHTYYRQGKLYNMIYDLLVELSFFDFAFVDYEINNKIHNYKNYLEIDHDDSQLDDSVINNLYNIIKGKALDVPYPYAKLDEKMCIETPYHPNKFAIMYAYLNAPYKWETVDKLYSIVTNKYVTDIKCDLILEDDMLIMQYPEFKIVMKSNDVSPNEYSVYIEYNDGLTDKTMTHKINNILCEITNNSKYTEMCVNKYVTERATICNPLNQKNLEFIYNLHNYDPIYTMISDIHSLFTNGYFKAEMPNINYFNNEYVLSEDLNYEHLFEVIDFSKLEDFREEINEIISDEVCHNKIHHIINGIGIRYNIPTDSLNHNGKLPEKYNIINVGYTMYRVVDDLIVNIEFTIDDLDSGKIHYITYSNNNGVDLTIEPSEGVNNVSHNMCYLISVFNEYINILQKCLVDDEDNSILVGINNSIQRHGSIDKYFNVYNTMYNIANTGYCTIFTNELNDLLENGYVNVKEISFKNDMIYFVSDYIEDGKLYSDIHYNIPIPVVMCKSIFYSTNDIMSTIVVMVGMDVTNYISQDPVSEDMDI